MGSFPLNPAQQAAVDHSGAPALVIAGAGSGKTRVLTQRIVRLIAAGFAPRSLFSVTFTNKASEELTERLTHMLGAARAKDVWSSTFHALGAELLRQEARHVAGGDRFVVYDAADSLGVVKECLRDLKMGDKRYDAGALLARISHAKNALTTPEQLPAEGDYDELAAVVFPRYTAAMKRLHALDFDDLILVPHRLLTEVEEVRERWHRRIRHLLVDEFQDTSRAQLLMVKALASPRCEVFCVGDDDQAIYGWRGADIRNVLEFSKHFPGARTLALEQNYRSRQPILDVANASIVKAERAWPKKLFTDKPGGEKPAIIECDSGESEVKFVVDTTKHAISQGVPRGEIAVLYRGNVMSKPMEEGFRLAGIPYKLLGGTSFYERREVKDLTAYLRLALHPTDDISFRRVVNYPARGIGDVNFERLERYARARAIPLFDASLQADNVRDLDERVRTSLRSFTGLVRATREKLEGGESLETVARGVAQVIELKEDLLSAGPTPAVAERRMNNVEDLYKTLARVPASAGIGAARQALARLALRFSEEDDETEGRVLLSTLHSSKGLEFTVVFFVGCDEGILPSTRAEQPRATDIASTLDQHEERRLFYVGVTRARETLYLVRAKARILRGVPKAMAPSRFLTELGPELVDKRAFLGAPMLSREELAESARGALAALAALRGAKKKA